MLRHQLHWRNITGTILIYSGLVIAGVALAPFAPEVTWRFQQAMASLSSIQLFANQEPYPARLPEIPFKQEYEKEKRASQKINPLVAIAASQTAAIGQRGEITEESANETLQDNGKQYDNRMIIPKIKIDMPLVEDTNGDRALRKGGWLIPGTSRPDRGGNTVVGCHRYLYTSGPLTCYHLDKLQEGDEITVYWKGEEYRYQVVKNFIVPPTAVEILDNTAYPLLTIFTCNPVFSTRERLVIQARLIQ